jgi:hypothetical protein
MKYKRRTKKELKNTSFILRLSHTTKVPYSPLRSRQRVRSFPTLILLWLTTKVKAIPFST